MVAGPPGRQEHCASSMQRHASRLLFVFHFRVGCDSAGPWQARRCRQGHIHTVPMGTSYGSHQLPSLSTPHHSGKTRPMGWRSDRRAHDTDHCAGQRNHCAAARCLWEATATSAFQLVIWLWINSQQHQQSGCCTGSAHHAKQPLTHKLPRAVRVTLSSWPLSTQYANLATELSFNSPSKSTPTGSVLKPSYSTAFLLAS